MITIYRGSDTVTFSEPEFNDEEALSLNQFWGMTDAGEMFFEDPGYETIRFKWAFTGVKDDQKRNLEAFIRNVIKGGLYTFSISWTNPAPAVKLETIYPSFHSATQGDIYPNISILGPNIYPSFEADAEVLYFHNLRLTEEGADWKQIRNGWWDFIMTFVKEPVTYADA